MTTQTRRAAQYIRMSTDRQDLSPLIQKEAIAAYTRTHGFEIVGSYEDEGKSGVQLSNRPGLRRLLSDVTGEAPFTDVLVYDVSRWGRFQDADAAAYYEYHCRMHGVQVTYVSESFTNDQTATSVLLKSMRRVMAAEYSRDIAFKSRAGQQRVISMGFHMGALPPLGYRRCSVSADGDRRVILEHGQRKAAMTDRIEWILGPEREVALVRKICRAYAAGLALEEVARLVSAEGWRTEKGRSVSTQSIKILLKHEALIGNFVWGVKSKGGKIMKCSPSRMDGSVPRIIDDVTWTLIQARIKDAPRGADVRQDACIRTVPSQQRSPRQLRLPLNQGLASDSYRRTLGSPQQLRDHTREFGKALSSRIAAMGMPAAFDTRTNVLTFWGARVRIRLMWPSDANTWVLERHRSIQQVDQVLVARMTGLFRPHDFFVLPPDAANTAFSRPVQRGIRRVLMPYWRKSPEDLLRQLTKICASPSLAPRRHD